MNISAIETSVTPEGPPKNRMKLTCKPLLIAICALLAPGLQGQTLNWGNDFSGVTDSKGDPLDSAFVIELGAFEDDFVPTEHNTDYWLSNWRVFDSSTYNAGLGYFSSTVYIENDVTSSNPSASTMSFAGLNAFLWIRKGDDPVEGSEWLLARASDWIFPDVGGDCCDTSVVEWSTTSLTSTDEPVWGRQNGTEGGGVLITPGTSSLQTFTFIPEPSSSLMAMMAGALALVRRRR